MGFVFVLFLSFVCAGQGRVESWYLDALDGNLLSICQCIHLAAILPAISIVLCDSSQILLLKAFKNQECI